MRKFVLISVLAASAAVTQVCAAPVLATVWGAKDSAVYHTRQSCPAYKRIKRPISFPSEDAAKKDGRRKCKRC